MLLAADRILALKAKLRDLEKWAFDIQANGAVLGSENIALKIERDELRAELAQTTDEIKTFQALSETAIASLDHLETALASVRERTIEECELAAYRAKDDIPGHCNGWLDGIDAATANIRALKPVEEKEAMTSREQALEEALRDAVEWFEDVRPQAGPGTLPLWVVDARAALAARSPPLVRSLTKRERESLENELRRFEMEAIAREFGLDINESGDGGPTTSE